jgi:hypothetical protein
MSLPASYGPAEVQRLKDLVFEGVRCLDEINSLREGLNDTIKSIGEELEIPTKLLKKVITVAQKGNFTEHETELKDLEQLLDSIGRK